MSVPNVGLKGPSLPLKVKIDSSTSDISQGDQLVLGTAGYYQQAAADGVVQCIALETVASPSADGDAEILADFSTMRVWEYSPDAGTVTQALVGTRMDCGGAQTINIDQSTTGTDSDGIWLCVGVDTDANKVHVVLTSAEQRSSGV